MPTDPDPLRFLWALHREAMPPAAVERLRAVLAGSRAVPERAVGPLLADAEAAIRAVLTQPYLFDPPRANAAQRVELDGFRQAVLAACERLQAPGLALSPDALARIEAARLGRPVARNAMQQRQHKTTWPPQEAEDALHSLGSLYASVTDALRALEAEGPKRGQHPAAAARWLVAALANAWEKRTGRRPGRKPDSPFARFALAVADLSGVKATPGTVALDVRRGRKGGAKSAPRPAKETDIAPPRGRRT